MHVTKEGKKRNAQRKIKGENNNEKQKESRVRHKTTTNQRKKKKHWKTRKRSERDHEISFLLRFILDAFIIIPSGVRTGSKRPSLPYRGGNGLQELLQLENKLKTTRKKIRRLKNRIHLKVFIDI